MRRTSSFVLEMTPTLCVFGLSSSYCSSHVNSRTIALFCIVVSMRVLSTSSTVASTRCTSGLPSGAFR